MRVWPPHGLTEANNHYAKIRADTIYHEIVRVRKLSIHAELSLPEILRGEHNSWRERDQRLKTAAVQRHVAYDLLVHYGTHGSRIGLQQRRGHGGDF